MRAGRGQAEPGWPARAARFLRRWPVWSWAYGGTTPDGVWSPPAGAGERSATAVLSWSNRNRTAARSAGRTASAWSRVKVPARNAATNCGSRLGADAVIGPTGYHDHRKPPKASSKG